MESFVTYLARKISRAKWQIKPFMTQREISADAITGCLRTFGNKLSTWRCGPETQDVKEVVLALAAAMERLETFDVVLLARTDLVHDGFRLEESEGETHVKDLRGRHVDIAQLTSTKLCRLGEHVATKVRANSDCYRFTRAQVKKIVCEAIENGRASLKHLHERLQQDIEHSAQAVAFRPTTS